jgi:hypothetical protein
MKNPLLFFQDFMAPFFNFLRSEFSIKYEYIDNEVMPTKIILVSSAVNWLAKYELSRAEFTLVIDEDGIQSFNIDKNGETIITTTCSEK